MKKVLVLLVSVAFLLSLGTVFAEDMKIGFVDIEKVFNKFEGTKDAKDKLQKKLEKEQKKIEKQKEEVVEMKEDLEKKASILDAKKLKAKQTELQEKLEKLQTDAYAIQQKLLAEEKELTADIVDQIRVIVQKLGKDEGYDLVFEKNLLLYGGDDITYLVIKKINEN